MKIELRNRKKCVRRLRNRVARNKMKNHVKVTGICSVQSASEGRVRLFVFVSLTGMAGRRRSPEHVLYKHG